MARRVTALVALLLLVGCRDRREQNASKNPETRPTVDRSTPNALPSFETMRLVLLGTGTPTPDPERSKPAVAVVVEGQPYIVDFGAGVTGRTVAARHMGIEALDIVRLNRGFATHLHSDHTSGLSDLWLTPAAVGRPDPLTIYGPPGIAEMVSHLVAAYTADLRVRTHGRPLDRLPPGYRLTAVEVGPGVVYEDNRVRVIAFPVSHGEWDHAFGYRFEARNRSIVISGDTAPTETVVTACDGCDLLVHEVYCEAGFKKGSEGFRHYHGTSHTAAPQLAEIAKRARPKRLVLYHILLFGCTEAQLLEEVTAAYDGEVLLGHDLDIF